MRILRLMTLPLFALSLSVSITGCDQKNDTLQGNQNNMTAFIKKIAANKESEETQHYVGNLNGIEIKLTYYYKGDIVLRQTSENKILYKILKANNKEEAQKMLSQVGEAYQGIPGLTEQIDYYDSYATEYVNIDFTQAKVSDLCKLPGSSINSCSAHYLSMIRSQKLLEESGYHRIN
ncbi:YehR family lipoprotein [Salmonella enterica subsp. enterica serovar Kotte]|nr:YehR family lipoprotein [Salmonella enterica subsp. enterica serovar Kotte]HED5893135.1 YehR family lipoprotein [Salmonella enterica]